MNAVRKLLIVVAWTPAGIVPPYLWHLAWQYRGSAEEWRGQSVYDFVAPLIVMGILAFFAWAATRIIRTTVGNGPRPFGGGG